MEIERKFILRDRGCLGLAERVHHIRQGYLSDKPPTVRIRIQDSEAFVTVKGPSILAGLARPEWEYKIPVEDAEEMLEICCGRIISKRRYIIPFAGKCWEVDIFEGAHEGLAIAEIELESLAEKIELPEWIGEEVTDQRQYSNAWLALSAIEEVLG